MHARSVTLVMSDSLQPYGLYPKKLLCPWEFYRQEYWSGLPRPPSGDLPNPRIKPAFPASPAGKLKANSLPTEPSEKSQVPCRKSSSCRLSKMWTCMPDNVCQLLYFLRYCTIRLQMVLCLFFMYYLCEKYCKPYSTVVYGWLC